MLLAEIRNKVADPMNEGWKQNLASLGLMGALALGGRAQSAEKPPVMPGNGAALTPFDINAPEELASLVDADKFLNISARLKADFRIAGGDKKLKNELVATLKAKHPELNLSDKVVLYDEWFKQLQGLMRKAGEKDINTNTVLLCHMFGSVEGFQGWKKANPDWMKNIPPHMLTFMNAYNSDKAVSKKK